MDSRSTASHRGQPHSRPTFASLEMQVPGVCWRGAQRDARRTLASLEVQVWRLFGEAHSLTRCTFEARASQGVRVCLWGGRHSKHMFGEVHGLTGCKVQVVQGARCKWCKWCKVQVVPGVRRGIQVALVHRFFAVAQDTCGRRNIHFNEARLTDFFFIAGHTGLTLGS